MQLMADIHAYISANLRQAAMLNATVLLQTELNAYEYDSNSYKRSCCDDAR